jgi:hypothetical protein
MKAQLASSQAATTPPQGDRKGPHSAPRHTRPYKDYEEGIVCSVSL